MHVSRQQPGKWGERGRERAVGGGGGGGEARMREKERDREKGKNTIIMCELQALH